MSSSEEEPELETLDISNDRYYAPSKVSPVHQPNQASQTGENDHTSNDNLLAAQIPRYGSKTIIHSLPAYDLWIPFFPTYLSEEKFRNFHRPKQRHYNTGPQARTRRGLKSLPIKSLTRHIYRRQKQLRINVMKAINNGASREDIINKLLLIRKAQDLSAKSGELFFFEYCEEFPPVLSQVGMAANVKTLIQPLETSALNNKLRPNGGQLESPVKARQKPGDIGFQEKVTKKKNSNQVYYSQLKPGSSLKVIENNLYRAPIYKHQFPSCDFLIIRTRNSLYIRSIETIFTVGQTMPLYAIPPPTEAKIQKFRCDLSNFYINKMFKLSETLPQTISISKLAKLFPDYNKEVLCRRMTINGGRRLKSDPDYFERGHSKYGLASTLELRSAIYPEHFCLNMAMLAARQRLRELNYTESMIDPPTGTELETEVLAAPWNTSKAVLEAQGGRAYLDLKAHLIDPTNPSKEGFSCVAWSKSSTADQQAKSMKEDAAKQVNQPKQFQNKNPLAQKIQREKLERLAIYHKEAQFITEVQARSLSSTEIISSDEESEDENSENNTDCDFDQQCRDLDQLISGSLTLSELNHEKEEEERRQLLAEINKTPSQTQVPSHQQVNGNSQNADSCLSLIKGKILKITRTYRAEGEGEIQRTEIVREPRVIALYVKKKGGNVSALIKPAFEAMTPDGDSLCHNQQFNCRNFIASDLHNSSIASTMSDGALLQSQQYRSRSSSLGPSELCRADGTILTISKKVLQKGPKFRECRRRSMAQ